MASAASYTFLLIDQVGQDKLLYNTPKLKQSIAMTRLKKKKEKLENINKIKAQISLAKPIVAKKLTAILEEIEKKVDDVTVDDIKTTHGIFLNGQFKPWVESTSEYSKVSVNSKPSFGEKVSFNVPTYGNFISDMCFHIRLSELVPASKEDKVRYANMLGHRLIKKVSLVINNVIIDSYPGEFYNTYYETVVSKDDKSAWLKCIGQELPIEGDITPDPMESNYRMTRKIYNGAQTLKSQQPEIDMFIPLLFWFNVDKKCALLNNFKQDTVKIEIELNRDSVLMTCLDTISEVYHEKYIIPRITESELYTNHIFVSEPFQSIFTDKIGFNLVRVHKFAEMSLDKNKDSINLIKYLKYPTEEMSIYARPVSNEEGIDSLNTWNLNQFLKISYVKECVAFKDTNGNYSIGINNVKFYEPTEIFLSAEMSFDETNGYSSDHPTFFNGYLPLVQKNVVSKGNSVLYFPYNMLPREYNPSGYANLSKCKKIRFAYESNLIESEPCKLYVHAMAINFLVFDNNSAILNYY